MPASFPGSVKLAVLALATLAAFGALTAHQGVDRTATWACKGLGLPELPVALRVLALLAVVYGLFLIASISLVDANTPLDDRILAPIFIVGGVWVSYLAGRSARITRGKPAIQAGLVVLGAVALVGSVQRSAMLAAEDYRAGIGFARVEWRHSPTIAWVNNLSLPGPIYSNSPEAIYLRTGRGAVRLPRPINNVTQQPNADYPSRMAALANGLKAGGVIVFFRSVGGSSRPTESELMATLPVSIAYQGSDGAVYAATVSE
jgi:hypothetical protein